MNAIVLFVLAIAGASFAVCVFVVGVRALRQSRTVVVLDESPPQRYILQTEPPSSKVQAISFPIPDLPMHAAELDQDFDRRAQG